MKAQNPTPADSSAPAIITSLPPALVHSIDSEALSIVEDNCAAEPISPHDLDKLKVPAGGGLSFEVQTLEGSESRPSLRGIVLASEMGRAYWPGEYDGDNTPPECLSIGRDQPGRGNPGGNCEICPMNEYESAAKGKGKACKEVRGLLYLMDGDLLPSAMRIPPSGLKAWRGYTMRLSKAGLRVTEVVTEMTLEVVKSSGGIKYSSLIFTMAGRLNAGELGLVKRVGSMFAKAIGQRPVHVENEDGPIFDVDSDPFRADDEAAAQ